MKPFPNLPIPGNDEVFSSWLFRCSLNSFACISDRTSLLARPDWIWNGNLIMVEDPDFDFDTEFYKHACEILSIDPQLAAIFFKSRDKECVSWEYRYWFCPECLRNDIRIGKIPAWRKDWCSSHSVFCKVHSIELVMLQGRPTYSKAWDAYVQICNQDIIGSCWNADCFVRFRITCFNRIKRWLSLESDSDSDRVSEVPFRLFRSLYNVFLQLPTQRRDAGVARTFFHQERIKKYSDLITYKENLFLCSQISEPRSRFGSMMLLGELFEITPQRHASIFHRYCDNAKTYFPSGPSVEDIIYLGGVSREEYAYLHEYLGLFPRGKWPLLDLFLARQEGRYRKAGVCSGMRLGEPP